MTQLKRNFLRRDGIGVSGVLVCTGLIYTGLIVAFFTQNVWALVGTLPPCIYLAFKSH